MKNTTLLSNQPLRRPLWQSASVTVARLTLESYLRSNWYWGEAVIVLGLFAALFFPFPANVTYFFNVGGSILYGVTILGTAILVHRAFNARTYPVLAKLHSRAAFSTGLVLAALVLRLPLYLVLLMAALAFGRITQPTFATILVGSTGLLANCFLLAALTVALSAPLATRPARIIFLAWLVAAFSPLDQVAVPLGIVRLPLLPSALCFVLGGQDHFEWYNLLAFVFQTLIIAGLTWLAGYWLKRRELRLQ